MKIGKISENTSRPDFDNIATVGASIDCDHRIASRKLGISDFKGDGYQVISIEVNLEQANELSFWLWFNKKIDIWIDKVEIRRSE